MSDVAIFVMQQMQLQELHRQLNAEQERQRQQNALHQQQQQEQQRKFHYDDSATPQRVYE